MDIPETVRHHALLQGGILDGYATDTAVSGGGFLCSPTRRESVCSQDNVAGVDAALQRLKPVAGL
jgi:hypothetical protein